MAEFDTFDSFLDWFENQKPEWQPVLAARIALRALPLAFADKIISSSLTDEEERILLQLFRAVLALDANANRSSVINSPFAADAYEFLTSVTSNPVPQGASRLATLLVNYLKFVGEIIERKKHIPIEPENFFRDHRLTAGQHDLINDTAL